METSISSPENTRFCREIGCSKVPAQPLHFGPYEAPLQPQSWLFFLYQKSTSAIFGGRNDEQTKDFWGILRCLVFKQIPLFREDMGKLKPNIGCMIEIQIAEEELNELGCSAQKYAGSMCDPMFQNFIFPTGLALLHISRRNRVDSTAVKASRHVWGKQHLPKRGFGKQCLNSNMGF